jgi:hypothetical protein
MGQVKLPEARLPVTIKPPLEFLMLSSTLYRLSRETVSLEASGSHRQIVRVPEGAVIEVLRVLPGSERTQMAEVVWQGKTLEMFVVDIERRGEVIQTQTTSK